MCLKFAWCMHKFGSDNLFPLFLKQRELIDISEKRKEKLLDRCKHLKKTIEMQEMKRC